MRGPSPLVYREEERHRALGRDATFSWSRVLTHPPRCNRTRHRDGHLVSDFVGSPSWFSHLGSEVVGAAILDLTSWGPPSWIGSDVKNAKVTPLLLVFITKMVHVMFHETENYSFSHYMSNGVSRFNLLEGL